jgi:hypothetical protein
VVGSDEDGASAEEDADYDSDNSDDPFQVDPAHRNPRERVMKKPVTLDINGIPWGNMKECLADDIKKYAKNLDPTANWESQPGPLKTSLFKRMYKGKY